MHCRVLTERSTLGFHQGAARSEPGGAVAMMYQGFLCCGGLHVGQHAGRPEGPCGCHRCRQGHEVSQGGARRVAGRAPLRTEALLNANQLCAHGRAAGRWQRQELCAASVFSGQGLVACFATQHFLCRRAARRQTRAARLQRRGSVLGAGSGGEVVGALPGGCRPLARAMHKFSVDCQNCCTRPACLWFRVLRARELTAGETPRCGRLRARGGSCLSVGIEASADQQIYGDCPRAGSYGLHWLETRAHRFSVLSAMVAVRQLMPGLA